MNTVPGGVTSLVLALAGLLAFAGCSSPPLKSGAAGPYAEDIAQAYERANDFQREILRDGKITDAEYFEAQDRFVACMDERGLEARADGIGNGYTLFFDLADPVAEAAFTECGDSSYSVIEPLYYAMRDNPRNEDMADVYAACMVRVGAAPEGFTGKELDELTSRASVEIAAEEAGSGDSASGRIDSTDSLMPTLDDIMIPGGASLGSAEVLDCYTDPQRRE